MITQTMQAAQKVATAPMSQSASPITGARPADA